ncbi:MAG: hypothetical protein KDC92_08095, partial [Bacteroidetes bacterium]|nr:hypothetical protein [Bacteroidota bacterium]
MRKAFGRILILVCCALIAPKLKAQCIYSFTASDTVGCINAVMTFTIIPKPPNGTKATWKLGPGTINGNPNASYAFVNKGVFDVSVQIELPGGTICNVERKSLITIGNKPTISGLKITPKLVCDVGNEVEISATAADAANFEWTVGSTKISNSTSSFKFKTTENGQPDIQVVVNGNYGCSDKMTFASAFKVMQKPEVTLPFFDTFICQYSTINYKHGIKNFGQTTLQYNWLYSGATPSTSTNPKTAKVAYNKTGLYDISLAVTDPNSSCKWQYNYDKRVRVFSADDIKINVIPANPSNCNNSIFKLDVTPKSIDPESITWQVLSTRDSFSFYQNDKLKPIIGFNYKGKYKVRFTYKGQNCTRVITTELSSVKNPIFPRFKDDFICICKVPRTVNFTNTTIGIDNYNYVWKIHDSAKNLIDSFYGVNFSPSITKYGKYIVSLQAIDKKGCSETLEQPFEARPFSANFKASATKACPGTEITFRLDDTLCFDSIRKIEWIFEDKPANDTSTTLQAKNLYTQNGVYDVTVTATTKFGCTTTRKYTDYIEISSLNDITVDISDSLICVQDEWSVFFETDPPNFALTPYAILIHRDDGDTLSYFSYIPDDEGPDELKFKPTKAGIYDFYLLLASKFCRDSVLIEKALYVNGVNFSILAENPDGCLPIISKMKPTNIVNYNFGQTDTSLTYYWFSSTPGRVNITNAGKKIARAE